MNCRDWRYVQTIRCINLAFFVTLHQKGWTDKRKISIAAIEIFLD
jgi:hypothetical protein